MICMVFNLIDFNIARALMLGYVRYVTFFGNKIIWYILHRITSSASGFLLLHGIIDHQTLFQNIFRIYLLRNRPDFT